MAWARPIPTPATASTTGWLISPTLARDSGLPLDAKPGRDNFTYGASMNLGWDFGAVKLTNIAAYDYLRREEYGDWDSSPSIEADTFFGSKVKVWSDELRLASNTDGPFQWVGGVYVSKQRQRERFLFRFQRHLRHLCPGALRPAREVGGRVRPG